MSQQLTFADSEFSSKRRQTRKEVFLGRMDDLLPGTNYLALSSLCIPRPVMVAGPIRWKPCCVFTACSNGDNLSDEAMEDALYEIASMRQFARLSLDKAIPDRTTIMNFRHLLEQHELARKIFSTVNHWLAEWRSNDQWHLGGCHHHSSPSSTKTNTTAVMKTCTRPRKVTSGTSA